MWCLCWSRLGTHTRISKSGMGSGPPTLFGLANFSPHRGIQPWKRKSIARGFFKLPCLTGTGCYSARRQQSSAVEHGSHCRFMGKFVICNCDQQLNQMTRRRKDGLNRATWGKPKARWYLRPHMEDSCISVKGNQAWYIAEAGT